MLKLNAQTANGPINIEVPSCWQEVTVHQFQRMVTEWNGEDWIKLFSIFSGIDSVAIAKSKDYQLESTLYASIRFVFEEPFDFEALPVPQFIVINSKTLQVPKEIGRLSIGQAIQLRKAIEERKDARAAISIAAAIYLQPWYDAADVNIVMRILGKEKTPAEFDYESALNLEQEILKMPIVKIFPVGFFLLRSLNGSGNWLTGIWRQLRKATRRTSQRPQKWNVSNPSQI